MRKQRRREQQLQASESYFRVLFESLPIGAVLATMEGEIISGNQAASDILGYSQDELKGLRVADLQTDFDPANQKSVENRLRDHGSARALEPLLRRKDGTVFPCRTNLSLFQFGETS